MHADERVPDKSVRLAPSLHDVRVDLRPGAPCAHCGAGAKHKRERELVRPHAAAAVAAVPSHARVDGEGVPGRVTVRGTADEGVVHEPVRVRDSVEHETGVRNAAADSDRGGEDELAERGGVGEEAPEHHERVELLDLAEAAAPPPKRRLPALGAGLAQHRCRKRGRGHARNWFSVSKVAASIRCMH